MGQSLGRPRTGAECTRVHEHRKRRPDKEFAHHFASYFYQSTFDPIRPTTR
jgi:hypothetical protein